MRTMLDVKRHQHLTGSGVFLIVVALIAGIASCVEPAPLDHFKPVIEKYPE